MTDPACSESERASEIEALRARVAALETQEVTRRRAEEALQSLVVGTAAVGEAFFPALARHLCAALDVRYAFVTRLTNDEPPQFETLAVWNDDHLDENMTYSAAGTPCGIVASEGAFHCATGVLDLFPDDDYLAGLGAVSYMGVRVNSGAGTPIGHLCIVDTKPLPAADRVRSIMRMFADRVAGELERLRTEEQRVAMTRELDHRVKNTLWIVLSVAEHTLERSTTLDEFGSAFTGRVRSLAIAHEMLAQESWEGAELQRLLRRIIEPHDNPDRTRCSSNGPRVMLPAHVAPPLCIAFHELLTNAAKHGALSASEGTVTIDWTTEASGNGFRYLRLHWVEENGPTVSSSAQRGYGLDLIEEMIPYQIRGEVDLELATTGVRCTIRIPLTPRVPSQPGPS